MIPLEETKKQIESLQNLISGGIIDASEGERKIYMLKEKAVLEKHDRAINTRSNGRLVTKVRQGEKLLQITAYTYEDIIAKLYEFYYGESNYSLEKLLPLWIDYRKNETATTEKTIKEDLGLWKKYLQGDDISQKALCNLKVKDYLAYFRKITKNRTLTRKAFNNLKSVMNGIIMP